MPPKPAVSPPEPIAAYLRALADPGSLRDVDALADIDDRLARDDVDVAERLELLLRRRTLQQVDVGPLEDAFVDAVPAYLEELGLTLAEVREDFAAVGVRDEVLDRIADGQPPTCDGPVTVTNVRNYVLSRTGPFTQKDLIRATGASRGTVGKVIRALCEEGHLEAEDGRPIVYRARWPGSE